jgi:hypothetical protein
MKPTLWDYFRKAFNARPIGMIVPPNWIGIGIFGLLGALNPGFWLIGLGLELSYLFTLGTNERFQRFVAATKNLQTRRQWQDKVDALLKQLDAEDQRRYQALESRSRGILEQQLHLQTPTTGLSAQGEGLGRMLWVFLRLLTTRQAINRIIRGAAGDSEESARLDQRIQELQTRLNSPLSEELRKSLTGQIDIMQQRLEKRREAKEKLAFLDAELTRIQEQIELVREQAVLATDPETVSQRIDQITTTLGSTTQWISDQQKIYGSVEDLMTEAPALKLSAEE